MTFEREGVPAVGVMTSAFVDGAELMGQACGAPDYPFAVIPHPVGSLEEDGVAQQARRALPQVLELLLTK